jgi:hypothetical protein
MAASRMRVPKKNKMKWKRENIEGSWEDEVTAPTLQLLYKALERKRRRFWLRRRLQRLVTVITL